jgi:CheY-like chemotaxis protein
MDDKKLILLIDQDEYTRFLIRDIFLIYGKNKFQVDLMDRPEAVDEYLKEKTPDVILMDLVFKKGDWVSTDIGLELLQKLKNNPQLQNTKIIIFSGYGDLKEKVLEMGADDFIIKGEYFPLELYNYISGKLYPNH